MNADTLITLWRTGLARIRNRGDQPGSIRDGRLTFICNICGTRCFEPLEGLQRERPSCHHCRSTVRQRSLIHLLSLHYFGQSLALPGFPLRKDLRGVGTSDWDGFAVPLAQRLGYTNTYYHQPPKLDIINIPDDMTGTLDFLITSDVLEHVAPPVARAFVNIRRLLKPGGVLIITVPWVPDGETREHFPDLFEYEIGKSAFGKPVLTNTCRDGRKEEFSDLVFHGGAGETLEMRVFSKKGLLQQLESAGFVNIRVQGEDFLPHGIRWQSPWSLPLTAEAPR